MHRNPDWLTSLIKAENLPPSFASLAVAHYLPLAKSIISWAKDNKTSPLVVGINGAQGTGKSTLSLVLKLALKHEHNLKCAIISIDDIYMTRQERIDLSNNVHPLLKTRGAPGTHDVTMGIELLQQLKNKNPVQLPVFDKSIDDRVTKEKFITHDVPVDIILFEGWCVGATAQDSESLITPCNHLEKTEDQDASWRIYTNQQLDESYSELFNLLDKLVMLKAPDFECVYHWRSTQEEKLRAKTNNADGHSIMNDQQIKRFIMHYERLTRWMFEEMPQRADCLLELNHDHNIVRADYA